MMLIVLKLLVRTQLTYEDLAETTEEEYAAWFSREVKQDHKTKLLTAKQANLMFEALENVRLKSLL